MSSEQVEAAIDVAVDRFLDEQRIDLTTAVEAGARAWFDHTGAQASRQLRDAGSHRAESPPYRWEDLPPIDQTAARALVLPIVSAALRAVRVSS